MLSELVNLRAVYLPLADSWKLIDNRESDPSLVIAAGLKNSPKEVYLHQAWNEIFGAQSGT